jgi:hypothetical protein
VAGGLAALDGRLRTGDIIQKVNGFKVFDPEEAILLFLEQDQDITLSIARKIKKRGHEPDLDYLESTLLRDGLPIRKVDSCGSLDSHTHHTYATLEPPPTLEPPSETGSSGDHTPTAALRGDKRRSRDLHLMATSHDSVDESSVTRMRLMAMSRDSVTDCSYCSTSRGGRPHEDSLYHSRRGSTPGQPTPLRHSRPITGSSPNLFRVQHSPPAPPHHHHAQSGSNILTTSPLGLHNRGRLFSNDRPSSTTPDGKLCRPIGGVIDQRKLSSPNLLETGTAAHEPRIMSPLSPNTQAPPSFHGIGKEMRRLPNRFESANGAGAFLEPGPAAGGAQGRRESLV